MVLTVLPPSFFNFFSGSWTFHPYLSIYWAECEKNSLKVKGKLHSCTHIQIINTNSVLKRTEYNKEYIMTYVVCEFL